MTRAWSERIEQHYAVRLPDELRYWFDAMLWRHPLLAEFRHPLTPSQLLDPPPGVIWAGFMLPDTLPLVGNEYGDWLCMRVSADGRVSEIICWNHGGGDWIPYGRRLAEALLYDGLGVAGWGVVTSDEMPSAPAPLLWARDRLLRAAGLRVAEVCDGQLEGVSMEALLRAGWAEVVIRRDRALAFLNNPLKTHSDPRIARQMNVCWEPEWVRWLFDTELIPAGSRPALAQFFDQSLDQLLRQDWRAAEQEALRVLRLREDLGWPWDLAGWAAERRQDWPAAVEYYLRGLPTSLFADESIRFRTHWFPEGYGKFSAARLHALQAHLPARCLRDPYLQLFWENEARSLRQRLSQHWLRRAEHHLGCQQYQQAYHCFYRAGWDCGLNDLDAYAEILDGIGTTATAAGASALARLANLHRRFLLA